MHIFFAAALFISAFLLFSVQPMIAKMVLPLLGGTPSVWNTSMLFFQAFLLLGYLYAHAISKWLSEKKQILIHLVIIATAVAVLPFDISKSSIQSIPKDKTPIFWMLRILTTTIGIPFFAIAASAPLLQKWFSSTKHANSSDPYFLYVPSNLGSLFALLSYPLWIEAFFRLDQQRYLWAFVYGILFVFFAGCGFVVNRQCKQNPGSTDRAVKVSAKNATALGFKRRFRWTLLAFIPSTLMLGLTSFLTMDIASIPLLWIIPLSIYLITFALAFSRPRLFNPLILAKVVTISAIVLVFSMVSEIREPVWFFFSLHLFFFFFAALLCHTLLAEDRPHTDYLTEYYLYLSIGGVLGGFFNAIVAPMIFDRILEYPLAIVLTCLVCSRGQNGTAILLQRLGDYILPFIVGGITITMAVLIPKFRMEPYQLWMFVIFGLPLVLTYIFVNRPVRFALSLGAVMLASSFYSALHGYTLHAERNFFGTIKVTYDSKGPFHRLYHGTTVHGLQFLEPTRQKEALTYYHTEGPFGDVIRLYKSRPAFNTVGIIGLGVGSMLAYAEPHEKWTYFEIDPAILKIAKDEDYFTYFKNTHAGKLDVILGDARLCLKEVPDNYYGLLVLDAFSSDVIPTHLLTREALQIYLSKIAGKGIIAINISSRYLDLTSVIRDLASDAGIYCLKRNDVNTGTNGSVTGKYSSQWIVMSRDPKTFGFLLTDTRWERLSVNPHAEPWSDDFSNILKVLKWQ